MNTNIPYIKGPRSNEIECLPTSALSSYILTEEEQQYIENLTDDTAAVINSLSLSASTKAGSSLCTQQELDKIYVRYDNDGIGESSRMDFKNFLNTRLVGNAILHFAELNETID